MAEKLIRSFIIIAAAVISYWLVIIIHETGHMCMGFLTGSSFVSFRIGPFVIYRYRGKLKMTKMSIPGTLGQCIMMPKESDDPDILSGFLYHAGGGLFNLISTAIMLIVFLSNENRIIKAAAIIFGAISLAFALINLVPLKVSVPNDGYNIMRLMKSEDDRKAVHHILRIQGHNDLSPSEIPETEYAYSETGEYSRVMKMLKGSYYLDAGNMEEAEKLFRICAQKDGQTADYYRLESARELLYCLLLRKADETEINDILDDELKAYIQNEKIISIGRYRTLYAYFRLFTKEQEKAEAEYGKAMKLIEKQPGTGEAKMERKLLELAKNA